LIVPVSAWLLHLSRHQVMFGGDGHDMRRTAAAPPPRAAPKPPPKGEGKAGVKGEAGR
jgi:hypothetical protein